MATIDLGKIKMVWRGAYNNATAYTIDDAVSLNGTSYICIAATTGNTPPNATYWNVLAQGGTDLGATLSNNQIAIKNNSGNIAGVNIGNAGEFLKVSSGATGYEFGAVASDAVKVYSGTNLSGGDIDFDNVFTDTYQFYKVHISESYNSTNNGNYTAIRMINDSGSVTSSNNYNYSRVYGYRNQSNNQAVSTPGNTDDNKGTIAWNGQSGTGASLELTFHNTRLSNKYTNIISVGHWYDGAVTWSSGIGGNHLKVQEAHRGFRLFGDGGGTLNIVNIQIYGFKN